MSDAKWWLVCYDVHDPDRLRKCAKHMEGYGHRVQYSVFRCWMTKRDTERRKSVTKKMRAAGAEPTMPEKKEPPKKKVMD